MNIDVRAGIGPFESLTMSPTEQRAGPAPELDLSGGPMDAPIFAVDVNPLPGETVLRLHGELDLSTQQLFAEALAGVDETVGRIVLDLSDLTFIDCANIGLICESRSLVRSRGGSLELRAPTPPVVRIMELTGVLPSDEVEPPHLAGPLRLPAITQVA